MIESIHIVLQYIIDHEHEDFKENPSETHVYYHAVKAANGETDANNQYRQACTELLRR